MKRKILMVAGGLCLAGTLSFDAAAQAKPDVLVKQRQAAMTLQAKYLGPMGAMAQGKIPYDAKLVQRNAAFLEALSKMAWDGFEPSTKGEKSAALPAVWDNPGEFKQAAEHFEGEAAKLAQLSKSGDEAAVKAQIAATGKSCGACHEKFREKR
ncbi:MAG: cytochrome c [Betaproteobacteria bacterium]|nr:cytochrome c [Betaproteobacteria bacterium]